MASPWSIGIPPAPLTQTFGFQTPACWLAVVTVLPGYGLMRLGEWGQGLTLALLFSGAFYFASTDSPDPSVFADYGHTGNVPPPIPRGPEWILLAFAAAIWLFSIGITVWRANRQRLIA